ncbi:MAG: ATP-binding cassette domain-containing protein [Candidatus Dojkabacteria bacterium]|nr:ATP-binding cassette domain-containing protein [Candidatus Dojkabacteria bacterium]MDQ7020320.1 ATP-binding cassette domain-containing protein [Candidatus Dojkabacteria bacterium]
MIKAENLQIEYKKLLFTGVNFILGNKERVGLVGLNGCGKTSLMKILAGLEDPDKGHVSLTKEEKIGYLPQELDLSFEKLTFVGEFLESLVANHYTDMWKVDRLLAKLELDVDEFDEVKTLSPGQKMKLYLAKVLIKEPTVLLIDEPTNHLDINGIIWLEGFLKDFDGIIIMISHDRMFLNSLTNKIFEIDEQTLRIWDGNYDKFLEAKDYYIEERARLFKAQEKKREQLEKLLENSRKLKDAKQRGKAVRAAKQE